MVAVFYVEDKWEPDKEAEADLVFGTMDKEYPADNYLMNTAGSCMS